MGAAARPLPPSADIGPGGQSVGQAAQFCLAQRPALYSATEPHSLVQERRVDLLNVHAALRDWLDRIGRLDGLRAAFFGSARGRSPVNFMQQPFLPCLCRGRRTLSVVGEGALQTGLANSEPNETGDRLFTTPDAESQPR